MVVTPLEDSNFQSEMSKARTSRKLRPRSDEEKAYHSVIMKKHWASKEYRDLRAKINADEEHRRKVSLSLSGEKNGMFGKTHTVESRKKMSDSRTGEKNFWFGKTKSEDYRKKFVKLVLTIINIMKFQMPQDRKSVIV